MELNFERVRPIYRGEGKFAAHRSDLRREIPKRNGLLTEGGAALMTLIGEATKLLVIAGLMWGGGDITILLIDAGHDLRVARILLGRINNALNHEAPPVERRPARGATGS